MARTQFNTNFIEFSLTEKESFAEQSFMNHK